MSEMEVDDAMGGVDPTPSHPSIPIVHSDIVNTQPTASPPPRDNFRDIQVKVHIRKPERDSWTYMGRGVVSQVVSGHSSRVGSSTLSSGARPKKRGNFVVISVVQGSGVVSWSLNALNNSETLRLLASIELACYKCKQALADPRMHSKGRRRIERVIKDDRRRRHRRRKAHDELIDAFEKVGMEEGPPS
ncbi:hypothetical protein C8F01DRAFT_1109108 [Mycena amicta]|nr:hypothetical protein C8F01DRAFT_1109108 [Mycena amicta]